MALCARGNWHALWKHPHAKVIVVFIEEESVKLNDLVVLSSFALLSQISGEYSLMVLALKSEPDMIL
jgi:hypothetical protein